MYILNAGLLGRCSQVGKFTCPKDQSQESCHEEVREGTGRKRERACTQRKKKRRESNLYILTYEYKQKVLSLHVLFITTTSDCFIYVGVE